MNNVAKNRKPGIELICYDKNRELQYAGKCKIIINPFTSLLIVKPANKEYKMISAKFNWKFDKQKHILFVYGECDYQDFALCFDKERRCKKVSDLICDKKEKYSIDKGVFNERFIIPILKTIAKNNHQRLKEIIVKWVNMHDNEEKEEYNKLLHEYKITDNNDTKILAGKGDDLHSNRRKKTVLFNGSDDRSCNLRKRKYAALDNSPPKESDDSSANEEDDELQAAVPNKRRKIPPLQYTKTLNASDFKLLCTKGLRTMQKRLLIFTAPDKKQCYDYVWARKQKLFYCLGCHESADPQKITAMFDYDDKGNQFVQTEEKIHVCTPIPYIKENYFKIKILRKPDYEILENCNTFNGTALIIFHPGDSTQFWEHHWEPKSQSFRCTGCCNAAKMFNQNKNNEYVELMIQEHKCKTRIFQREKFYKFSNFVVSPNYEVQIKIKNGKEKKALIIFNGKDRSKCYYYYFQTSHQQFLCNGCISAKKSVSAKICHNDDGEEYVLLSNSEHICEPRPYTSSKIIVLLPSKFKFMESTATGVPKLFIFDENNRKLCHVFFPKAKSRYVCTACSRKTGTKSYTVYLCKNDNGEYYVQIPDRKHSCALQKYQPEKYDADEYVKYYDFACFQKKNGPKYIAIFHPQNKNLCYKFDYDKKQNFYRCNKCWGKRVYFFVRVKKDENGTTYLTHKFRKHVCKPVQLSLFEGPEYEAIDKNELHVKENPKKKKPNVDESKILKMPAFELQPSMYGNIDYKLIIFHPDDRRQFYQYNFSRHCYFCRNCKLKNVKVTAKVETDENGEKYVILGENDHVCEPLSDENKKVIDASNFIIQNQNDKSPKLFVFTSPSHKLFYEFRYVRCYNYFQCNNCYQQKIFVFARIRKDENGSEYLQMGKKDHICTPQKYENIQTPPKPAQTISLPNNLVEFHKNKNGEENKKLIIFTSEEKDCAYFYYGNQRKIYYCLACQKLNLYVSAKLCTNEHGEEYLKLDQKSHLRTPKKVVDPFDQPDIPFELQKNTKGEADKKLIIFTSEKRYYGYMYQWKRNMNYICAACHYRKSHISATLLEDENGRKLIKLCSKQHICEPKKM